jgi:hypothetical protein
MRSVIILLVALVAATTALPFYRAALLEVELQTMDESVSRSDHAFVLLRQPWLDPSNQHLHDAMARVNRRFAQTSLLQLFLGRLTLLEAQAETMRLNSSLDVLPPLLYKKNGDDRWYHVTPHDVLSDDALAGMFQVEVDKTLAAVHKAVAIQDAIAAVDSTDTDSVLMAQARAINLMRTYGLFDEAAVRLRRIHPLLSNHKGHMMGWMDSNYVRSCAGVVRVCVSGWVGGQVGRWVADMVFS